MRDSKTDLAFFDTNRFRGSKVKEIAEHWIGRALRAEEENGLQRQSIQDLSCQAVELRGEIAGLKGEIEYLTSDERKERPLDNCHATTERLWQWARETLTGEIADQFWGIAANGHLMTENPEYHQRINILRYKAKQAEAQVVKMQGAVKAARYAVECWDNGFGTPQAMPELKQALADLEGGAPCE